MTELEIQQMEANISKLNAETRKLLEESFNIQKKNRWFEFSLMLAIFGAGIAFAKLFL